MGKALSAPGPWDFQPARPYYPSATECPLAEKQNQPPDTSFISARRAVGDGQKTAIHVALLVGVCLLLCWRVLIHGIPDISHDGVYHAVWAEQFATQFWQGDWYPRWFSNINAGFGGPSGFFYPPLNNYVCSLFWPLLTHPNPTMGCGTYGSSRAAISSGVNFNASAATASSR